MFLASFIFDLHLKKAGAWHALEERFGYMLDVNHWMNYQNYLILPGIIFWSAIALMFLNPFDLILGQGIILTATLGLTIAFWYLKTVFYAHKQARAGTLQVIFLVKLLATYLAYAAAFGLSRYFGYNALFFAILIFGVTFLLLYQAFFQHHYISLGTVGLILLSALAIALIGYYMFSIWNVNYFSGALAVAVFYNTIWGLMHHKLIEKNLSRDMVYEYLTVLFVVLVIIFSTTNFSERVL